MLNFQPGGCDLLPFLGFTYKILTISDLKDYQLPVELSPESLPLFFNVTDRPIEHVEIYKDKFIKASIGNALREQVEYFCMLLDGIYFLILASATKNQKISEIEKKTKTFEGKGLTEKIQILEALGILLTLAKGFQSLYQARNCLVHRAGVVGAGCWGSRDYEIDSTGTIIQQLKVQWHVLEAIVEHPDGTESRLNQGHFCPAGAKARLKSIIRERIVPKDQTLEFSLNDLNEIVLNFQQGAGEALLGTFKKLKDDAKIPDDTFNGLVKMLEQRNMIPNVHLIDIPFLEFV